MTMEATFLRQAKLSNSHASCNILARDDIVDVGRQSIVDTDSESALPA